MFRTIESLDTCVILRAILRDVVNQRDRVVSLLAKPGVKYRVSAVAILECVYVLSNTMNYPREKVADWLGKFLNADNIECDKSFHAEIFEMFLKYPNLSYGDCYLSVETARKQAEPLWTFDQALARKSPVAKLVA